MHEMSIVAALLEQVEAEARARRATRVHRVVLRLGSVSGVDRELLATAYSTFRQGSICEAAELAIVPVEARWSCPHCGTEVARPGRLRCGACDRPARLAAGDEIVLERIEMEVA